MNISRLLVAFIASCLISFIAQAKGLDSLKPDEEETAATANESKDSKPSKPDQSETKSAPGTATGVSSAGTPAPAPVPAGTPATPGAATDASAPVAAKVVTPSATSKAIADKLHIGTSLGIVKVSRAKAGDWSSTGLADVLIGWRFIGGEGGKYNLDANLRYLPIEVSAEVNDHNYRGVIESYNVGPVLAYHLGESLDVLASAEVGYVLVYLNSLDHKKIATDAESNGVEFTVGTGLDWLMENKKIKFGPRIYAGFGKFQTMQASAAATVLF